MVMFELLLYRQENPRVLFQRFPPSPTGYGPFSQGEALALANQRFNIVQIAHQLVPEGENLVHRTALLLGAPAAIAGGDGSAWPW